MNLEREGKAKVGHRKDFGHARGAEHPDAAAANLARQNCRGQSGGRRSLEHLGG
jgi:hypothetical protein